MNLRSLGNPLMNVGRFLPLSALLLSLFLAHSSAAQDHPFLQRGATRESLSSIDSVNLSNGNVVLTIPIGPQVRIGGSLSFGLNLYYNSKLWDTAVEATQVPPLSPFVISVPSRKSSAGVGWTLSVGQLIPPWTGPLNDTQSWMYVGPDGSERIFYEKLHLGDPQSSPGTMYTRDGSYLRMKNEGAGKRIEFPNGIVHIFDSANRLIRIQDHFSTQNYLDVSYENSDQTVIIEDRHQRIWRLEYENVLLDTYVGISDPADKTIRKLISAEVPGYGGQVTYGFNYETHAVEAGCAWIQEDPPAYEMPMLTKILLPETGSQPRLTYEFQYYESDPAPQTHAASCREGAIKKAILPTKGSIEWTYQSLNIKGHCSSNVTHFWGRTAAVSSRKYLDIDDTTLLAEWKYAFHKSIPPTGPTSNPFYDCTEPTQDQAIEALLVTETTPSKDKVRHAFTVWPNGADSEHGVGPFDYQLPYVKPGVDGFASFLGGLPHVDDAGRFLSRVEFDCDTSGFNCKKFSAAYVLFENERPFFTSPPEESSYDATHRNDRLISNRTVYFDADGELTNAYETISNFSRFDGLGNFRRIETTSTFPGDSPTTFLRDFNVHHEIPDLVLGGSHDPIAYQMLGEDKAWVLGTYTVTERSLDNQGSRVETLFDYDTGFLERRRVLSDSGPLASLTRNSNDVLTVFEHAGDGNITSQSTYGGSLQDNLSLEDLDVLQLGNWEYRKEQTYDAGYFEQEIAVGRHGGTLFSKDLDRDHNTGLTKKSRDSAGVETTSSYDSLGRLTAINPPADAPTTVLRTNATTDRGEEVVIERSVGSTLLFQERSVKDGFGRNVLEEVRFPGGDWNALQYEYGINGLLRRLSSHHWKDTTPGGWTEFKDHDPRGRPLTTVAPDTTEVRLNIDREHAFTTTSHVATGAGGGEHEISRLIKRNSRGQIISFQQDSDAGESVETTYEYDVGGRLIAARTPYSGGTQDRLFHYDNRGFLLSEDHPEKGTVTYEDHDSTGKPGTATDGSHKTRNVFDGFGRMVQLWDDNANRLMLERFFSRENLASGNNKAKGKLVTEKRHNHLPSGEDVVITQVSSYAADAAGRLSNLRTRSNTGFNVDQVFTYDQLGNLSSHDYPLQDILPGATDPDRTLRLTYDWGRISGLETAVDGSGFESILSAVTYHPQGLAESRTHGNGVVDHLDIDPTGMTRPLRLYTTGVELGENWASGDYAYDGSGNVKGIGDDTFRYDDVERLVHAHVAGVEQGFSYDLFGNLVNLGGEEISVETSTNRLQDVSYDGSGNLLSGIGSSFTYDVLNMATSRTTAGSRTDHLYGPGNERIAIIDPQGNERWTVRAPSNRVVREYARPAEGPWTSTRDYFYADGLVAAMGTSPESLRHYHRDHLTSPRLITDGQGAKVSGHTYLPFGEEIPDAGNPAPDGEVLKFTGHERDTLDLDYMHARYYGPFVGRFLSIDPAAKRDPESLVESRYAYTNNNPIGLLDPDGLEGASPWLGLQGSLRKGAPTVRVRVYPNSGSGEIVRYRGGTATRGTRLEGFDVKVSGKSGVGLQIRAMRTEVVILGDGISRFGGGRPRLEGPYVSFDASAKLSLGPIQFDSEGVGVAKSKNAGPFGISFSSPTIGYEKFGTALDSIEEGLDAIGDEVAPVADAAGETLSNLRQAMVASFQNFIDELEDLIFRDEFEED